MSVASCKIRMQGLMNNWKTFERNHHELFAQSNVTELLKDQPYFTSKIFDNLYEKYLEELSCFQEYLDSHQVNNQLNLTINDLNNVNHTIIKSVHDDFERLPRLDLPTSDGQFKNKPGVPDITKLRHLITHVQGDAASLVQIYSLTDKNFVIMWKKLNHKYENKRRLINAHISLR